MAFSSRGKQQSGGAAMALVCGLAIGLAAPAAIATQPAARSAPAPNPPAPWVELNGARYHIAKQAGPTGEMEHRFSDGRHTYTFSELSAHLAAQPARKIAPALETAMAAAGTEPVPIVIVLVHQPAEPISREVWSRIAAERKALAEGMRAISRRVLARPSIPEQIERDFIPLPPTAQEVEQRRQLAAQLDNLERAARREIHSRTVEAITPTQDELAVRILELGGEVTARVTTMNILGAELTPAAIRALAASPLVAQIDLDHAGEPELNNSAQALGVSAAGGFWQNSVTGGIFDVGVLDTGVQMNHPALLSHPYLSNMGPVDTGDHGTHVAGIMASTDATHRGMAFGADHFVFALAGSITTSMPGMAYIMSTGEAEVVNYSFGNGSASSNDYTTTDQFFDGVVSTFGSMVSKSTGNSGFGSGNPTITHPAPAFNLMACANINDANTPTRSDDWISSSSSRGPTAGGRKKPDIGAPGTNIMSTNKNWAGGTHFVSKSGTSMAAPHVGGAIVLLYDLGVNSTTAGKAILINTADATEDNGTSGTADDFRVDGSRWNRRYGWGYMNLAKAYLGGLDYFEDEVSTGTPRDRFQLYAGQMFQHEKATLVWRRHVAYNGATFPTQISLLSDLDLFAYNGSLGNLMTSSTSSIDNVEQLSVQGDAFTVLKVKAIGSFGGGILAEPFALATQENFARYDGPAFEIELIVPAAVDPGAPFDIRADITNSGDLRAHDIMVTISGPAIGTANPVNIGGLDAAGASFAEWEATAAPTAGSYPITINVSSNSYGEVFTAQLVGEYIVGSACYANCDQSTASPVLNVDDFTCFINAFAAGAALPHAEQLTHYANCDNSTAAPVLNVDDFTCFINTFAQGCP